MKDDLDSLRYIISDIMEESPVPAKSLKRYFLHVKKKGKKSSKSLNDRSFLAVFCVQCVTFSSFGFEGWQPTIQTL